MKGILVSTLALSALTSCSPSAPATDDGDGVGSLTTAERFVGAWTLEEWRSTDESGAVRFPYGEDAAGQIVYTATGRMSASLMSRPDDPAAAPEGFLAYWGSYVVDDAAGTVTHQVVGANRGEGWIGSDQVRAFEFQGEDVLILSVGQARLTWRRVR